MPKAGSIHKNYKEIKILCTNGTEFITRSTYHNANGTMRLDIDPSTHPAWNPNAQLNTKLGQVEGFNTRFAGLNFLDTKADTSKDSK